MPVRLERKPLWENGVLNGKLKCADGVLVELAVLGLGWFGCEGMKD